MFRITAYTPCDIRNIPNRVNGADIYLKKDSDMKIKIISVRLPRYFNGERLPSFTDEVKYFIMYKNHWWQRYKYLNDNFTRPMKFDSADAAKEFLKKEGIAYED